MLYFVQYRSKRKIECWDAEINNPAFTPLTEEQIAFYRANPTASIVEVEKCELNPPYIPDEPSFSEVQSTAIAVISEKSLVTLDKFVSAYQLANAQCSVLWAESNNKGEPPIYDLKTAQGYIDTYLRIGGLCRAKFYETKRLIESAVNKAEIEEIKASAISYYDTLE